ncbi:hypothetical protein [Streptomyces massasporeus]|uniref:hypothetical protein n=1 Tax=Streptomyces massasporeus TaxID=67324 RepID=UPI00368C9B96
MSNPVAVLLGVLFLAIVGACCLAIVSHRRITEQALKKALPEAVPAMLDSSGKTLTNLLKSLLLAARSAEAATRQPSEAGLVNGASDVQGDVSRGTEGATQ